VPTITNIIMARATLTRMATAAAPTDVALWALCAREHAACFACRPVAKGGLGLFFGVQTDGSVAARWTCPPGGESYRGIVHGGLLATALDSAMVHALFARGIVARTAELKVRYRRSAGVGEVLEVRASLRRSFGPLHELEAEIRCGSVACAHAQAKFMADNPAERASSDAANLAAMPDRLVFR
jgi:acyl-coenzyme A thioesterase PaaI-like protein